MAKKIDMFPEKKVEQQIIGKVKKQMLGRTITNIRFMSEQECDNNMWDKRGVVIELDDGNILYPMCDEEGNNSGVIATSYKDLNVIGRF